MAQKIAVIGLGYVGLPVALALGRKVPGTIGFDINQKRVESLAAGKDSNGDVTEAQLKSSGVRFTSDEKELSGATFFIVAVPTPIDLDKRPDLGALESASRLVGRAISKGGIAVFESTVYPGVTEEICGAIIAEVSGLVRGKDFKLGYSPERINPGDHEHTLEKVIKVVAGEDAATLEAVAEVYGLVVEAGLHKASSIKVAEAAKVIENTQRDLNIALMNELALIFDKMGISTTEVLAAAGTKWNFLRFSPGLVGGHCIGVDPYYLTTKAEQLGYQPLVITAGRRINDAMGQFIAQRAIKLLANNGTPIGGAKVGILGLTFKENISDIRNSRVPDIANELREFGINALIHDPLADPHEASVECGVTLTKLDQFSALDCLILAVSHDEYMNLGTRKLEAMLNPNGVLLDVKSILKRSELDPKTVYWSL